MSTPRVLSAEPGQGIDIRFELVPKAVRWDVVQVAVGSMCQPLGNYDMSFALLSTLKSIAGLFVLLASKPKVMDGLGGIAAKRRRGARPLSFANDAVTIAIAGAGNLP